MNKHQCFVCEEVEKCAFHGTPAQCRSTEDVIERIAIYLRDHPWSMQVDIAEDLELWAYEVETALGEMKKTKRAVEQGDALGGYTWALVESASEQSP